MKSGARAFDIDHQHAMLQCSLSSAKGGKMNVQINVKIWKAIVVITFYIVVFHLNHRFWDHNFLDHDHLG